MFSQFETIKGLTKRLGLSYRWTGGNVFLLKRKTGGSWSTFLLKKNETILKEKRFGDLPLTRGVWGKLPILLLSHKRKRSRGSYRIILLTEEIYPTGWYEECPNCSLLNMVSTIPGGDCRIFSPTIAPHAGFYPNSCNSQGMWPAMMPLLNLHKGLSPKVH